jgi:hypothetical protein
MCYQDLGVCLPHCLESESVPGFPVLVKSGHRLYDRTSPGQELKPHAHN